MNVRKQRGSDLGLIDLLFSKDKLGRRLAMLYMLLLGLGYRIGLLHGWCWFVRVDLWGRSGGGDGREESQEAFKLPVFDWPMNQAKWSVRQQAFHQQEMSDPGSRGQGAKELRGRQRARCSLSRARPA